MKNQIKEDFCCAFHAIRASPAAAAARTHTHTFTNNIQFIAVVLSAQHEQNSNKRYPSNENAYTKLNRRHGVHAQGELLPNMCSRLINSNVKCSCEENISANSCFFFFIRSFSILFASIISAFHSVFLLLSLSLSSQ